MNICRIVGLAACVAAIIGCQSQPNVPLPGMAAAPGRPAGRLSSDMGPPPPGYWKIVGGSVPGWRPEDMHGLRPGPRSPLSWEPLGPRPITYEYWSGYDDASGRVVGIAPHPTDPETCYIASASGGVWKTIDGGLLWTPITDELSNLNHGAIAIDPNNPDTVYVGTGEYTTGSNGDGLFRSTDGGVNWEHLAPVAQVGARFSGITVDPVNPDVIHLTTNFGYVRSTDGGGSWSVRLAGSASALALNPLNPSIIYVGRHNDGVYRSTNGGDSWVKLTNGLPASGVNRILIGISRSNPDVLYTAMSNGSHVEGTYRTSDGGDYWTKLVNTPDFAYPQAWYDMYVAVDPTDEDTVYCGGVSPIYTNAGIIKSTNGGVSWTEISAGVQGGQTHPDHHFMAFGPDGTIWEGNDGGVWKSNNGGLKWINTNATLTVTQNYTVGGNPQDNAQILGGTQDNGSIERVDDNEDWPQVIGGDGGFLAYDFEDPNIKYTTYVFLSVQRWIYGNYSNISGSWGNDPKNFIAPLVMDPNDSHTLLGGTNRVWRTLNAHTYANWDDISTAEVANGGTLNAIAVAVGDSDTIYTGSSKGTVWVTTDATNWNNRSTGLPGGQISDLILNPDNPASAYVSYSKNVLPRILRTDNYGVDWTDVTGDLPSGVAATALAIDWRFDPPGLYIGTGAGVWSSTDGGATWIKDENDLPNVNVGDLQIDTQRDTLIAGTYGRGTWRAALPSSPCPADVNADGTVDIDDIFKMLEAWGTCEDCPEDVNSDGLVNIDDVFGVLGDWGPCP
ncbi:MAG: hypothetical protein JSV91_00090 [Phycisphaerales bacterium]|nr:MAG: hypothetical protein JSV91_00090 [Phycisphaerales bacterium]